MPNHFGYHGSSVQCSSLEVDGAVTIEGKLVADEVVDKSDPLSTRGDLLTVDAALAHMRLGIGPIGSVLTPNASSDLTWIPMACVTDGDTLEINSNIPAWTHTTPLHIANVSNPHSVTLAQVISEDPNSLIHVIAVDNLGVGTDALNTGVTGARNVGVGARALDVVTTADDTTAVGTDACAIITTGPSCTAVGSSALAANLLGGFNTAVGHNALSAIGDTAFSRRNTAVGQNAGLDLSGTCAENVYIGFEAARRPAPVDDDVIGPAPALISGLGLVLRQSRGGAVSDHVDGLEDRIDTRREQLVEVQ